MNKIKLSFIFLMIMPMLNIAQELDNLPFYTPPSPSAYELGKYGQIPVGMFTGTPIYDLPLFQYKTRNLTVPVSVSYNSNGIKVDQVESRVGLGWSLNAGGVITRIARDLPDEEYLFFFPEEEIESSGVRGPWASVFFFTAGEENNDTETDLFMYNFLGKSGKFVYDNNKKIIQMPHSDMKIESFYIDEYSNGYSFITSDGVKYIFSKIETSRSYTVPNNHPDPEFIKTTWYLTKIIHPFGDEIDFSYESESYTYITSISQSFEVLYPQQQPDGCGDYIFMTPIDRSYNNHSTITGWRIKDIRSPELSYGKVKFTTIPPPYQIGIPGNYLLSKISVIDKDSNEIEKFDFNYQCFSNSKRAFLESIIFKDPDKFFTFEYIEPSLFISRLSFQQDHWGYFNGASTNSCLIPKIYHDDCFSNFDIGADREPHWNFSKRGLLNKIHYPTKGTTELIYEPNSYNGEQINYPDPVQLYLVTASDTSVSGNEFAVTDTIFSSILQRASVSVNVEHNNSDPCIPDTCSDIHIRATLIITDLSNNQEVVFYNISPTGIKVPRTHVFTCHPATSSCFADLSANRFYKATLTPTYSCVSTSSTINYCEEFPDTVNTNIETGGSRIKKIVTYDPVQDKEQITRYYYGPINNTDISSGDPGQKAYYITRQNRREECFQPVLTPYYKTVKILSSSSITPLFNTGNNNIYYKYVTVSHGGDNFENGGEEYEYIVNRDIIGNNLCGEEIKSAPWTNFGWDNGMEKRKTIFLKNQLGNKIKLKEIYNNYHNDNRIHEEVLGYSVRKESELLFPQPATHRCTEEDVQRINTYRHCITNHKHFYLTVTSSNCIATGNNNVTEYWNHPCYGLPVGTILNTANISNLDIMEYKNISYWNYLDSTTTVQYDQNGVNPVTSTVHYIYDNPTHVQITRTETASSNGDSLRENISYPDDLQNFTCKDSLLSQHRIAEKIMEEEYVKDQSWRKISTQKKTFKDWGNSILQPEYIESSTFNNPLEIRARFYNIDNANGNPLEFSKEDDMHTSYIWGYQKTKQVIEGKNVTYNNLNSAVNLTNPNLEQLLSQTTGIGNLTLQSQRNQWKEFNNTLRNQPLLSDAFVTTYTYKPLVGITSVTDPAGITSYYEYDSFGRLAFVRDNDYNIA